MFRSWRLCPTSVLSACTMASTFLALATALLAPKAPTKLSFAGARLGIKWQLKQWCCSLANWPLCMWSLFSSLALILLWKDSGKGRFWNDSGSNVGDLVQTVNMYLLSGHRVPGWCKVWRTRKLGREQGGGHSHGGWWGGTGAALCRAAGQCLSELKRRTLFGPAVPLQLHFYPTDTLTHTRRNDWCAGYSL